MWTRAHSSPEENYEIQPRDVFFSVAKSLPVHNPNSIHKYDDKSWRCEPGAGRQREAYQLGRRRRPDQPLCRKHLLGQSVTRQVDVDDKIWKVLLLRLKEHWVSLLLKPLEFSGATSFSIVSSVTYWKRFLRPLDQLNHFYDHYYCNYALYSGLMGDLDTWLLTFIRSHSAENFNWISHLKANILSRSWNEHLQASS